MRLATSLILFGLWSHTLFASDTLPETVLPLDDLQRFTTVIEQVRRYYVSPVDDEQLFRYAIHGILAGLDPHSSYLEPNELSNLRASTSGQFGGLGVEVALEEGAIKVISPLDGTPAARAGIKAGDMIIRLDKTLVKGLTLKEAVTMMRGKKGTSIVLTVLRQDDPKPLKFKVTRETIAVRSVRAKVIDKHYGYIRIAQFQTDSAKEVTAAINQLKQETNDQLKGVVLDLRNNPGGILDACVKIADAFLDKDKLEHEGLIVYAKGRLADAQIREVANNGDILKGAPMIILINGGSASASEIVAGALQDHKRALIVGTRSFGKGSVQTILPLKDRHGLKLTTALYFTPKGRVIQATGIVPDILIPDLQLSSPKAKPKLREADLQGHLNLASKKKHLLKEEPKLLTQDYQLNESLNLLKGLTLVHVKSNCPPTKPKVKKKEGQRSGDPH